MLGEAGLVLVLENQALGHGSIIRAAPGDPALLADCAFLIWTYACNNGVVLFVH